MPTPRMDDCIAAFDAAVVDAGEVQRHPIAGADRLDGSAQRLDRADPGRGSVGPDDDVFADGDLPPGKCPGDHGAATSGCEHAVDPEPGPSTVEGDRSASDELVERDPQCVETGAGRRGHG